MARRSIRLLALAAASALAGTGIVQAQAAGSTGSGAVAKVSWAKTSMSARGEIRGLTQADLIAAPTKSHSNAAATPSAPPPTPAATWAFSTGTTSATRTDIGGNPADSTVAATRTNVCITTRAAFACYTKSGRLIKPGAGLEARPYTAVEFFATSGINVATAYDGSNGNKTKDGRVVYDVNRSRLFMVFQTREPMARLLIAVSKSANPRDGWWTYADTVGNSDANQHDYNTVGITAAHFLVTNSPVQTDPNPNPGRRDARNFMYSADKLAAGLPYTRGEWGHAAAWIPAAVINNSISTDAYWVNRDDATHASIWAVRSGTVYRRTVTVQTAGSPTFGAQPNALADFTIIGREPQNAEFRNGKVTWASNVGHTWSGQSGPNNAIQLAQANVTNYFASTPSVTVLKDRIFGRAAPGDSAGTISDYGWPAVATNSVGDIVVGEVRSNSSTPGQLRSSVWFAGQPDISSSALVQAAQRGIGSWHMAGAMADPSTNGVYISQQYGVSTTSPDRLIRIAKILGTTMPDIYQTVFAAPNSAAHGGTASVSVTVLNQGDKSMPASIADIRLSNNNILSTADVLLKQIAIPAIAPGGTVVFSGQVTIPAGTTPGSYWIGSILDRTSVATEYNENNANPLLAGNRGNDTINIT